MYNNTHIAIDNTQHFYVQQSDQLLWNLYTSSRKPTEPQLAQLMDNAKLYGLTIIDKKSLAAKFTRLAVEAGKYLLL